MQFVAKLYNLDDKNRITRNGTSLSGGVWTAKDDIKWLHPVEDVISYKAEIGDITLENIGDREGLV